MDYKRDLGHVLTFHFQWQWMSELNSHVLCLAVSEGMDWKDISKKGMHSHIPQQRAQQVSNSVVIIK